MSNQSSSSIAKATTFDPSQPSSPPSNYQVHHLPHPCSDHLVGQFISLRLRAHSLSPTSFASTFAQEAVRTPAQWSHLLSRPHFHVFIVVLHPSSSSPSEQLQQSRPSSYLPSQGHWLGHISLLGPLPKHVYDVPAAQCPHPSEPDSIESKWHMTALWTDPSHRGRGLASRLVNAAMKFAGNYVPPDDPYGDVAGMATAQAAKQARIRINTSGAGPIVDMYRHWRFQDAGRACPAVAMRENGDEDLLPEDVRKGGDVRDAKKWWDWYGTSLDRVVMRGEIEGEDGRGGVDGN